METIRFRLNPQLDVEQLAARYRETGRGSDGHVEQAFTPSFNALNIFTVPQPHSVSMVTPFAASRRYSVTGWLRSGVQPS